jgi:hypothetical protein
MTEHSMTLMDQMVTLDQDGYLHLRVNRSAGSRVRVIVEDVDGAQEEIEVTNPGSPVSAGLLEQSAFVRDVLANPAEDAWNDV